MARPLLFCHYHPTIAEATGVPTRLWRRCFWPCGAPPVAEATQVIGGARGARSARRPGRRGHAADHPTLDGFWLSAGVATAGIWVARRSHLRLFPRSSSTIIEHRAAIYALNRHSQRNGRRRRVRTGAAISQRSRNVRRRPAGPPATVACVARRHAPTAWRPATPPTRRRALLIVGLSRRRCDRRRRPLTAENAVRA